MMKYLGYMIDRSVDPVTITSPSGKLMHTISKGTRSFHELGQEASKWVRGLAEKEPDPDAEYIGKMMAFLGETKKANKRGTQGTSPCPFCTGTVRWSIAGCNGHIHAHCTTPKCLSVME